MLRSLTRFALAILLTLPLVLDANASESCTRETLRRVVDEAGARLRVVTAETQPRIMAALRRLKEKRGWTGPDGDEKAGAFMTDDRTAELDTKAATLLALIDELSETSGPRDPQCSRLAELEAASLELQATVKAKAHFILAKLEREAGGAPTGQQTAANTPPPSKEAAPPKPVAPPAPDAASKPDASPKPDASTKSDAAPKSDARLPPPPAKPKAEAAAPRPAAPSVPLRRADEAAPPPPPAPAAPVQPSRRADAGPVVRSAPLPPVVGHAPPTAPPPIPPKAPQHSSWSTETTERAPLPPVPDAAPPVAAPAPPPPIPQGIPTVQQEASESFSRDEIREAGRGFFGTISGGLASVFEHAFSTLGRPAGYVLGNEGGGAFIAGLRYGKGTLFLRNGSKRELYWHGPSIGYDFGASGAKTMFLVYNLRDEIDIFSGFSGVEGSAYLVGGVGMTVLTDGKVIMAPIRSGLGLRFGANVGYIRFTARPTWNPF